MQIYYIVIKLLKEYQVYFAMENEKNLVWMKIGGA